jgi:hypothetical protein
MEELFKYKGHEIKIEIDDYPLNPRTDWDHGTTILSTRPVQIKCESDYQPGTDDLLELKKGLMFDNVPIYAILPLYYINNGYGCHRLSTEHDFGQLGWIYITQADFKKIYFSTEKDFKAYHPDKTIGEYCREQLKYHVQLYEDCLNRKCYMYTISDPNGEEWKDGCIGGYFGDDHQKSGLYDDAKANIDFAVNYDLKQRYKRIKSYIKSAVPLLYRKLPSIKHLNLSDG